jgi:hypothetical protein
MPWAARVLQWLGQQANLEGLGRKTWGNFNENRSNTINGGAAGPPVERLVGRRPPIRDWDSRLQLFDSNEECLVSASQQLALITSLPFVHTARRSYRLDSPVKPSEGRLITAAASNDGRTPGGLK